MPVGAEAPDATENRRIEGGATGIEAFLKEMEACEPATQLTSGANAAGAAAAICTARGAA